MRTMKSRLQGITLIELLIGMAILGLILGLIVQFFTLQTRAAAQQKATNEASEAARVALSLVTWDLQNAGFRVPVSDSNPGIHASNDGYRDAVVIRYFDETVGSPQRIRYDLGDDPIALRRAQYADGATPNNQPTVAIIAALNIRYNTRPDKFTDVQGSGSDKSCPSTVTVGGESFPVLPVPAGASGDAIENCEISWQWRDTAFRLVREVKVQLLARSDTQVPGHTSATEGFTFESADGDTVSYTPEPGFVYRWAEQTIVTPNLIRN